MNARLLEAVQILFRTRVPDRVSCAIEFLELITGKYGDEIRKGSGGDKPFNRPTEERARKFLRCRNSLMQISLNKAFLRSGLSKEDLKNFDEVSKKIDSITSVKKA